MDEVAVERNSCQTGRMLEPKAKCTTTKADCSPMARTCVTVWMWTAWAASTRALNVHLASAASSAAVTGSGFTSRWKWKVAKSSGTSLPFSFQIFFCFSLISYPSQADGPCKTVMHSLRNNPQYLSSFTKVTEKKTLFFFFK